MTATQSNLSNYGYDLVVAVTQESLNLTLGLLLEQLPAPEVTSCWVTDTSGQLAPISLADLKAQAKGSDPFQVAKGADPATDQDLINLAAANYAGGFKAQIGLPTVTGLPPVVTLTGGPTVLFNLLCADFQITGFNGAGAGATWIDQSQPTSGKLWYFSATVPLNSLQVDPGNPPAGTTAAVQQRIAALQQSGDAFSVQQLFLDLDQAIVNSAPTIANVPAAVWQLIQSVFIGAYMTQLAAAGKPTLGYTVTVQQPDPGTLQLGAIAYQVSPVLDGTQPIVNPTPDQQNAASFDYLGSTGTALPQPQAFSWNWIEPGETGSFSGVVAVRRAIFVNFLASLLNDPVAPLCQQTLVALSNHGDHYGILYTSQAASPPQTFQSVAVGAPGSDGFTAVLSLAYAHTSHGESEESNHLTSIHGDFNYTLTGSVAFYQNTIRLILQAQAYMSFYHHELGFDYHDLPGANYCDKTLTALFQLTVGQSGALQVSAPTPTVKDTSHKWDFDPKGLMGKVLGLEGNLKQGLERVQADFAQLTTSNFTSYQSAVAAAINGQNGWVFPASQSFVFADAMFSSAQDLVAHLTYAAP